MADIDVDPIKLGDSIAELAAHLDRGSHELLTRIRHFDEVSGWYHANAKSCAHWLSWRIGLGPLAAREYVRVARALGHLTRIDAAMARGELSFTKVRAMTRVATPENEEQLLLIARHTTGSQLEKICQGVDAANGAAEPSTAARAVWIRPAPNGMMRITADLLPDEAALVMKAIEHARGVFSRAPRAGKALDSRADAFVEMMRVWLEAPGGETPRPTTPVELLVEVGPQVVDPGWSARLDDGTIVTTETLRRLACDAGVVVVATDADGNALDIGRRTRVWPTALRRALWRRDRGCRFPGCTNRRFLDAHHLDPWLHGGKTSLAGGALLCRSCHRLVHEGGWTVVAVRDELVFRDPSGREVRSVPPPPPLAGDSAEALAQQSAASGVPIDARTNLSRWDGQTPDYGACIEALLPRPPRHQL